MPPRRRLARISAAPARGRLVVRFNVTRDAAANIKSIRPVLNMAVPNMTLVNLGILLGTSLSLRLMIETGLLIDWDQPNQ